MSKRKPTDDYERRKQSRLHKLGTDNPRCSCCPQADWRVIEEHHPAGQKRDRRVVLVCANCHRILTDAQKDHPKTEPGADELLAQVGNFLLGLADMFELVLECLREFGKSLIARANEPPLGGGAGK